MPRQRGELLAILCLLLAGLGGSAEARTEAACSPTLFGNALGQRRESRGEMAALVKKIFGL